MVPRVIEFYIREERYGFLSNFWRHEQILLGNKYDTNEHYYQSRKSSDYKMQDWIARAPTAYAAMKAGRNLRLHEVRPDWNVIKVEVMYRGLKAKFGGRDNESRDLRNQLIETGDAILNEKSPVDMFWGGYLPGSANMLGKLLMQVREDFRDYYNPQ